MIEYEPLFAAFAWPQPELRTAAPSPPLLLEAPPPLLLLLLLEAPPPLLLLEPLLLLLLEPLLLLLLELLLLLLLELLLLLLELLLLLLLEPLLLLLEAPPLLLEPLLPCRDASGSGACPRSQAASKRTEPSARDLDALLQTEQFTQFLSGAGARSDSGGPTREPLRQVSAGTRPDVRRPEHRNNACTSRAPGEDSGHPRAASPGAEPVGAPCHFIAERVLALDLLPR